MDHVNLTKLAPKSYQALSTLTAQSEADAAAAGLDKKLVELVKIRASQLNSCAFCLRAHVRDAKKAGETDDRLAVVAAWWESQYFTAEEQEALQIAERITGIGDPHSSRHEQDRGASLTPEQVAAISWVVIVINVWNRMAVTSGFSVAPSARTISR